MERVFAAVYGEAYALALGYPLSWVIGQSTTCALACRQDGRFTGAVLVRLGAQSAFLNALAVLPEARRKGVASILVREALRRAEADAARRMMTVVDTVDDAALHFYRGLGFGFATDTLGRRRVLERLF